MTQHAKEDDLQGILKKLVRFSYTFQQDKQSAAGRSPESSKYTQWVMMDSEAPQGLIVLP